MKKVLVTSILGMALNVASSYGQGYIQMQTYELVGGVSPTYSAVTYAAGVPNGRGGQYVGANSGFKVYLLVSLTGVPGSFTTVSNSLTSFYSGSADGGSPTTDGAGIFVGGPTVVINGYTGGSSTAYFILEAYTGLAPGLDYIGYSSVFSINTLQTSQLLAAGDLLNLGGNDANESGTTVFGLQPFTVGLTPEPSMLALSGMGAAALMLIRRKK